MLIAKLIDEQTIEVSDYKALFPNTSFPSTGPTDEFMIENQCMYVNTFLPHDKDIEKLVPSSPYILVEDETQPLNWVYTVKVEPLTQEEIDQRNLNKKIQNKATAMSLLQQTDWTAGYGINNPEISNPYLSNQEEFLAYRSLIREIAVNPPVVVETWPELPEELWVKA